MKKISKEELETILRNHKLWLEEDPDGVRAYLTDTDLRGANLRGADLRDADLRWSDLTGADLTGADLRGAYLNGACLDFVKGLDSLGKNRNEAV